MKPNSLLVCAMLLASSGCVSRQNYVFVMPATARLDDVQSAINASDEWNACNAGVHTSIEIGESYGDDIPLYRVDFIQNGPPNAKGKTEVEGSILTDEHVVRVIFLHYEQTQATIAHEIGHVLGLKHYPDGLMLSKRPWYFAHVSPLECQELINFRNGNLLSY